MKKGKTIKKTRSTRLVILIKNSYTLYILLTTNGYTNRYHM